MLIVAGLQVPVIPLFDVVGNVAAAVVFWQRGPICVNVAVTCGLMVIFTVAVVAHWPAVGVKMHELVPAFAVLMIAGFQVPVTPLLEVVANAGALEF